MNNSTDENTTLTALSTPDSRDSENGVFTDISSTDYTVYFHIGTAVRILVCVVGACLCSFVLVALKRCRNSDLTSTWFISDVLVTDLFLSIRHFYLATSIYFRHPKVVVVAFVLDCWTTLPALLSVLCMGLDQLLAVFFPLQMRTRCSDTLKKVLYSGLIWLPSLLFMLVVLAMWYVADDLSALALADVIIGGHRVFALHILIVTGLNVLVYMMLITRVIIFTMSSKMRGRQLDNAAKKQRRLIIIFFVVFFSIARLCL